MKIVDAVWEKRNLGVATCEVTFDAQDSLENIAATHDELFPKYEYLVFRVPCNRSDIALILQGKGCLFIETAITLQNDLKNIFVDGKYKPLCNKCSWALMSDKDLTRLYDEIKAGIFQTDRIYLDPYFSKEVAANRYVFWTQDLVAQNCLPHKIIFGDKVIGFFLDKAQDDGSTKGLLAGIYHEFLKTGLGFLVQYAGFARAKSINAPYRTLNVSSNNLPVIKINLELGAKINKLEYVLIKHRI